MKANIPVYYKTKCKKCGAKIEFKLSETHKGEFTGGRFITCPGCKNEITILYSPVIFEEGEMVFSSVEPVYEGGEADNETTPDGH